MDGEFCSINVSKLLLSFFSPQICRTVWLGLYDAKTRAGPESREEHKVRDFMIQKYEKKRWYVEPSQAAAVAKAKADSTAADKTSIHSSSGASSGTPEPRPLRTLVGETHVPNLVVGRVSYYLCVQFFRSSFVNTIWFPDDPNFSIKIFCNLTE